MAGAAPDRSAVPEWCASTTHDGEPPRISVVVPTFGRVGNWPELLDAFETQSTGLEDFELVVVDDHSPDGTWALLQAAAARTQLRLLALRLPANMGSGAARSAALPWCRAPVVAFTDDDCLPAASWLEHLVAPFSVPAAGQSSGLVVQGRTVPRPEELKDGGPWGRTLWVLRPTWLFETCNIAYRKADLQAVGGFPSRHGTPVVASGRQVGEDALAGWGVVEGGATLVFVSRAVVHHRVLPATYWQWLADHKGREVFPALAARSRLARRAFWCRWFLSSRSAAMAGAVAGLAGAVLSGRRWVAAGALPWVILALPEAAARPGRHQGVRLLQLALADAVGLAATAVASVRHRAVVL